MSADRESHLRHQRNSPINLKSKFCSVSRAAIGHFATCAKALSTPESCRSFKMVLASRYAWLDWV